ncbi:MAG: hypothetical protein ACLQVD_10545 [Capsulimonadaceae bacterium]
MTITLTSDIEARLRDRAEQTGQDVNDLASSLLADALRDPDILSEEDRVAIRHGIRKGLEAAKIGHERPLNDYIVEVARRRSERAGEVV